MKELKEIPSYIRINSTYNNTGVSVHKENGLILYSVTAGALGFKKSKRSTTYAAQSCGEKVAEWLIGRLTELKIIPNLGSSRNLGFTVYFNGIGTGKLSVIRGLTKGGIKLTSLIDITAVPHNGCKPPLPRRL